ncbi:UTP--glucose-1-phosphate uridylyltransferase [Paenibacillus sp. TAB 01]|uniref:UTP--glucose-1-phosphate uridylyltransferase n=1 Tax=Paenibacillus sp. TAB 01 TaxID=3368988 RepID=UPI003753E42B
MKSRRTQAEALLAAYGQEQLLRFYDELPMDLQEKLLDQIFQIDLKQIDSIRNSTSAAIEAELEGSDFSPIPGYSWDDFTNEAKVQYEQKGWELLQAGRVGAIVVAGGQGSRLGYDGPKGTYDIGLPSGKSLFQLQAERLLNISKRAGAAIPWYIMTSPENDEETRHFFEHANYFGMDPADCFFFQQGVMPVLDDNGKILLSGKGEISLAPSGNGDCFAALERSGALKDMKRRGLAWLFYYNVDNALVKVADPCFVGLAACHNHPVAAKALDKSSPEEQVGVLCLKSGRPAVVEYTVIPEQMKNERDEKGKLVYGLGSISMQLFRFDFIEKFAKIDLPYAMAHKKIPFIDPSGKRINPDTPNAFKFERFIFDYFPLAEQITALKVKREEEFAPVKNKEGVDSPATARQMILSLHRSWLLAAGVPCERLKDREIEISPLLSYAGENLSEEVIDSLGL